MRIIEPSTPSDFEMYYRLRWEVLRKPWNQPVGSEKDSMEDQSIHAMMLDEKDEAVAVCRLQFNSAEIYKIDNVVSRVEKMIDITGLGVEQKKKIGALSKGFRQRVGLAQAMIHDPKVLILDEPTSGLDPNQLVEIRNLIKEIGREKTVILSTHIMQEVKAICSRVIIINKGKMVADDKAENLQQRLSEKAAFIVEFDKEIFQSDLLEIEGIDAVEKLPGNKWKLESAVNKDIRPSLFNYSVSKGLTILTLQKEEHNLEDIFHQLTQ